MVGDKYRSRLINPTCSLLDSIAAPIPEQALSGDINIAVIDAEMRWGPASETSAPTIVLGLEKGFVFLQARLVGDP